jgi:hypothetical protein
MTKQSMKTFLTTLAAAAILSVATGKLCAQTHTPDVTVMVHFSNGQAVTLTDFSDRVGVQPNGIVNVTVQLAAEDSGQHVRVNTFDGGFIPNGRSGIVASDGTVSFSFRAPANAGENRIVIREGSKRLQMHFWVIDSANPQNNPPVVTPANPGS